MFALAAALALALALGPSAGPPARSGAEGSNAARARAGLLPRKRPPPPARADARPRRIVTVSAPAPTFLAEPAPLARLAPVAAPGPPRLVAPTRVGALRLSASGVRTDVTLTLRFDP